MFTKYLKGLVLVSLVACGLTARSAEQTLSNSKMTVKLSDDGTLTLLTGDRCFAQTKISAQSFKKTEVVIVWVKGLHWRATP